MNKDSLVSILKETSSKAERDGGYTFDPSHGLALLVGTGGAVLSIERVTRVVLREGCLTAETERGERYFVDTDRIVALREHKSAGGSGFLPGNG
jgi:hypothetical protein